MAKKKTVSLGDLDRKLDRVIDAMATKEDIDRLEKRMDGFDLRLQRIIVALDTMKTSMEKMLLEYAAISTQLSRHEEWFKILAKKTGVKLPI